MKKLALLSLALLLVPGCVLHRSGSQAVHVDPFLIGSDKPAVSVANNQQYQNGEPWDLSR